MGRRRGRYNPENPVGSAGRRTGTTGWRVVVRKHPCGEDRSGGEEDDTQREGAAFTQALMCRNLYFAFWCVPITDCDPA